MTPIIICIFHMYFTKKIKTAWLFVAVMIPVQNLYSQEMLMDTIMLDEIVVTATKTQRNLKDVPARISVIRSGIIENAPVLELDDILRFTAGINVNRSTGIYSQRPMVTLRGLSGDEQSRTLVLMNGVPINTSDEGGVNWNRMNPNDIDRIEVFKGPGSSLYGNNAMGGVINLITRIPSTPQEVYAAISYGTFNTIREDLNIRIRTGKGFYGSLSQYYVQSDGYNNIPEEDRTPYDVARSLEEIGISARAGFDKNRWFNAEMQYDVFRDKRGEGYQIYTPDGCYRNFNTNLLRGNIKGSGEKTRYDLNLYYQLEHYYDVNEKLRGTAYTRYDVNSFRVDMGLLFSISRELTENNTLTGGFELKQGSIKGGDYYQTEPYDTVYNAGKIRTLAGYIQDEHALFKNKIRLIAGLRFDRVTFADGEFYTTDPWNTTPELTDHTWSEISPRLGLRFNFIREVSAYVSYSHGFRASILDDLTRTGWMWVGPKYANPDLGPESINNYETGLDITPVINMKISASAYYAKGDDMLYYVTTGDSLFGRPIYIRENVTSVTMKGLEFEMNYELLNNINLLASYNYADSKIGTFAERPELVNKQLSYVPKHRASVTVLWRNKIVNLNIRGLYKGDQFGNDLNTEIIDSYVTFDAQLSRSIKQNFTVSLDIQNILDNRHMETIDYIAPGRIMSCRMAVKF
ncbi:MAG: TonB-dependent receptor [Bacteroidales bacterium]|nr:TonB-dependent receptor [Bacteroidales bacterium]